MQSRRITSYFKRPGFALASQDSQSRNPPLTYQSSPSDSPSQSLPSDNVTPQTPNSAALQLNQSLSLSAEKSFENDKEPQGSFQSAETGTSFGSSQRVIKKGKEVVISSDGDDTDSLGSIESPEELFKIFAKPKDSTPEKQDVNGEPLNAKMTQRPGKSNKIGKSRALTKAKAPVYKNSLDNLVTQAVDDNKTESGIAQLRASLAKDHAQGNKSNHEGKKLHEGMLTTALGDDEDDGHGLKRLLDAIRRTEAFDLGKTWSFFDNGASLPSAPKFPRECISPGTYISVLREPESRERAFHSGIVDFALSRELLPDSLITWIFFSITSECRDSLRYAYCRALKRTPADRLGTLILPKDIDKLFQRLGANAKALALSEPIIPDPHPERGRSSIIPQNHAPLISVLDIIREAAGLFSSDTREHILKVLLRLTLDVSLTSDSMVCPELERALTAVFESIAKDQVDGVASRICTNFFTTLKDIELQSRLLQHLIPTLDWVASLRRRLALIFLTKDPSIDTESGDVMFEMNKIIDILKERRFDVKRFKRNSEVQYDYTELGAIITFLNIAIDSGWSETKFEDRQAENDYNARVDTLSDRMKKIFASIEDSGASHLKRTLAKEALESLHYRVVYSVRTKPPPKKSYFGGGVSPQKTQKRIKWKKKEEGVPFQAEGSLFK